MQSVELRSSLVPIEHLRRIYRIRLRKPKIISNLPIGSDRLLSDLDGYQGANIRMVVWGKAPRAYCVMLDDTASRLVACLVSRDRSILP
jgi:hypothetical protein